MSKAAGATRAPPGRDSHDLIRCAAGGSQAAAEQRGPTSVFICISNRLFTSAERLKGTLKARGGAQLDRFYRFGRIFFFPRRAARLLRCNLKARAAFQDPLEEMKVRPLQQEG